MLCLDVGPAHSRTVQRRGSDRSLSLSSPLFPPDMSLLSVMCAAVLLRPPPQGTFKKRSVMPAWYRWVPQIVFISSSQPALGVLFWKLSGCKTQFGWSGSNLLKYAVIQPLETWALSRMETRGYFHRKNTFGLIDWLIDWLIDPFPYP